MAFHLHTHSYYSFLEGLPSPVDLAKRAAQNGMSALALTDHLSLTGAVSFYQACREQGVQPILGLEIDLRLPYRLSPTPTTAITGALVLLAMDIDGWHSLCRISSHLLNQDADPVDRRACRPCTLEKLASFSSGLICLTGGCRGAVQRLITHPGGEEEVTALLDALANIFPNRLYLETNQQCPDEAHRNHQLTALAYRQRLPVVAAHNTYYLHPDQADLQRTLASIREIVPLNDLDEEDAAPPHAAFLSPEQLDQQFIDHPEALAASVEIAARCQFDLPLGKPHYPLVPLPARASAVEYLRQKTEEGARRLYGSLNPVLQQRIDQEIEIIAARGYEPIFLIAEEMLTYARKNGVPSASRGSASSSLVAHCIGITTPDPLALDLYFERFLNPARATPPDIDTDFCSRRRDDVINHLFDVYGHDRVAMVGTINTFRARSALSEVAKAHGFKPAEIRPMVNSLTHRYWSQRGDPEPGQSPESPFTQLIARYGSSPRHARVIEEATAILGMPHHLSVHPGGVVIAPGPIVDYVPVTRSGGKGVTITQFDLDDVERAGLVKLDLLGIRGLTVLNDVATSIRSWRRKEYRTAMDVLESVPEQDPDTSTIVSTGRTIGCFQIESPGMRATLRDIQARSIPDIMAALALYRPGPLKGGLRDAFVRRYKHEETVSHIHPALSSLLCETYGVILYQEQVLRIAHELAGFSLAEADLLRRAMSHFDPGKQMQVLKEKFVSGAQQRSGVPAQTGVKIWEMMAAFAGYGFPKAHAASYAVVAWRSAWCKAHYPAEFIAAVLANWGGYYPQSVYLSEARRMGFAIRPPHVNHSLQQFSAAYPGGSPVLYMGLDQVHDLTHRTQTGLITYRPFHSLSELVAKVDPRRQELENLIRVGALEGIGTIPDLLCEMTAGRSRPGQLSLFPANQPSGEDWTLEQKIAAQQRLLGTSIEAHPLELYTEQLQAAGVITSIDALEHTGETVRVAGIRQTLYRIAGNQGEKNGLLTLEDSEGVLDVALSPELYRQARNIPGGGAVPLIVEGMMERDPSTGDALLRAARVQRLE
jgi:DNA-directed DNA polymerase III PolC